MVLLITAVINKILNKYETFETKNNDDEVLITIIKNHSKKVYVNVKSILKTLSQNIFSFVQEIEYSAF